ncbi:MAG: sn-glycerol-3-phosphate ABC transporter permease UgpA [Roseinatronobacter sp.]
MRRRVIFEHKLLPYLLLAPQLIITIVFFLLPAGMAMWMSLFREDMFGLTREFVWFENYATVLRDPNYLASLQRTAIFSISVALLALLPALLLAVMADKMIKAVTTIRTILIIPYAIAPAIAGVLWLFMFNPAVGTLSDLLRSIGIRWNPTLNGTHAMALVILASIWKQISYNFLFFLAGLQAIPKSLLEAASIDGAGSTRRFWTIVFPLLSPVTFFLVTVNIVYAFFDTFGVIHAVTQGGPARATEILVYKAWYDGIIATDFGRSAAQSVILMAVVIGLTAIQFRYIDRKVTY